LAENAPLPAGLAQLAGAMAGMLERHMTALDVTDPDSTAEHAVYGELAAAHRRIADQLRALRSRVLSAPYRSRNRTRSLSLRSASRSRADRAACRPPGGAYP
jgi:hypothetical protein